MSRGIAIYILGLIAILGVAIAGREYPDIDIPVIYALAVITFPSGLLCIWAIGLLNWALSTYASVSLPAGLLGNIIYISASGLAGLIQWKLLADRLNKPPPPH